MPITNRSASVPSASGLFDVYIDMKTPQTVNAYKLTAKWGTITVTTPTLDVNGNLVLDVNGNPTSTSANMPSAVETPINFLVKASSDASNWTTIATFNNVDVASWQEDIPRVFAFTNTDAFRFWRLENTTTQGDGVSLAKWSVTLLKKESELKINGIAAATGLVMLSKNDVITCTISNSNRLYDSRNFKIAGPANLVLSSRTAAFRTIDPIVFPTLVEPYPRSEYTLGPVTVSGQISGPIDLVGSDSTITFEVNDSDVFAPNQAVMVGDDLVVSKIVRNFMEKPVRFFQIQKDPLDLLEIPVDVGGFDITNIQPSGPVLYISPNQIHLTPTMSLGVSNSQMFIDANTKALYTDNYREATGIAAVRQSPNTSGYSETFQRFLETSGTFGTSKVFNPILFATAFPDPSDVFAPHLVTLSDPSDSKVFGLAIQHAEAGISEISESFVSNPNTGLGVTALPVIKVDYAVPIFMDPLPIFVPVLNVFVAQSERLFIEEEVSTKEANVLVSKMLHQEYSLTDVNPSLIVDTKVATVATNLLQITDEKTYIPDGFSAYAHLTSESEITRFMQILQENQDTHLVHTYEFIVLQEDEILEPIAPLIHVDDNHVSQTGLSVFAKLDNVLLSNYMEVASANGTNVYLVDGPTGIKLEDIIWTTNDIENYGAFNTQQEAVDAALAKGHTPFFVYKISGTESYTYRKLNSISRACGLINVGGTYPVARLLKGG